MKTVLITGGSGFFGSILKKKLLDLGFFCVNVDLVPDDMIHPNLVSFQGDISDFSFLKNIFEKYKFDAIFHVAAMLAHAVKDKGFLWRSNVEGTRVVRDLAIEYRVPKIVFISSNCLWARNFGRPVLESDIPEPIEIYGKSKWEGEKILLEKKEEVQVVIFRVPTIIEAGRLGLLAILFEFIDENRKVWVVGKGTNRYQFIYAPDLAEACLKALSYFQSSLFNVGSDDVKSLQEVYEYVIRKSQSKSRVAHLPQKFTIAMMKLAYFLKISPLGPYHYKMIAEDFLFDTTKIKKELGWKPTVTNEEMLWKAYEFYKEYKKNPPKAGTVSAHRMAAPPGIIKLLKWVS